jgi:hypothetical protein
VYLGAGLTGSLLEFGERLLLDGDDNDVVAEAARALQGKEGEPAVPRDDSNGGHELDSLANRRAVPGRAAAIIV